MRLSRLADSGEIKVQQLADELVGMLCGEAVSGQRVRREIPQILGHDDIGPPANRSRQDASVIRIP